MRRLLAVSIVCLSALCAEAQTAPRHRSKPIERSFAAPYWYRYPQFTKAETRLVLNWFQDALEQGEHLAVAVPAGIMSQIHRGAVLSQAAAKSLAAPPQGLLDKLPPMPQGYERMIAGAVMLIVKTDEQLVVDTLQVAAR